jgi:hypothetical protein
LPRNCARGGAGVCGWVGGQGWGCLTLQRQQVGSPLAGVMHQLTEGGVCEGGGEGHGCLSLQSQQ